MGSSSSPRVEAVGDVAADEVGELSKPHLGQPDVEDDEDDTDEVGEDAADKGDVTPCWSTNDCTTCLGGGVWCLVLLLAAVSKSFSRREGNCAWGLNAGLLLLLMSELSIAVLIIIEKDLCSVCWC